MESNIERRPGKSDKNDKALSKSLRCPILEELMSDPVVAADGHSYERAAITEWIRKRGGRALSPLTGEQLSHLELIPNLTLRAVIGHYKDTLPRRRELELTAESLHLAINLREEELSSILAKKDRQLSGAEDAKTSAEKLLGPLALENQRLLPENQQQQLEIERLRREVTELREEKKHATESILSPRVLRSKQQSSYLEKADTNPSRLLISRRELDERREYLLSLRSEPELIGSAYSKIVNQKNESVSRDVNMQDVIELLDYTARGELNEVQKCLTRNRDLAHVKGDLIDLSGAIFPQITGFQHAVWSGDEDLWNIYLEFLSETDAYNQLMALLHETPDTVGLHGKPLSSFDRLISAYEFYRANSTGENWNGEVAHALLHMPAWFVYLFSEKGPDKAWPQKQITRGFTRNIYDLKSWVETTQQSGLDRGAKSYWAGGRRNGEINAVQHDIENSIALKRECLKKFDALLVRLSRATVLPRDANILIPPGTLNLNSPAVSEDTTVGRITKLLTYTVRGQLQEVREYLKCNNDLVYDSGDITDLSKRDFSRITGFQRAIWDGDEEMWNVYLDFLPPAEAYVQLVEIMHGRTDITEKYGAPLSFFDRLLAAHNSYKGNFSEEKWRREVGGAHYGMPAWFVYIFSEVGEDKAWPKLEIMRKFTRNVDDLQSWFDGALNDGWCRATFSARRVGLDKWSESYQRGELRGYARIDIENCTVLRAACIKKLEMLTERLSQEAKSVAGILLSPPQMRK